VAIRLKGSRTDQILVEKVGQPGCVRRSEARRSSGRGGIDRLKVLIVQFPNPRGVTEVSILREMSPARRQSCEEDENLCRRPYKIKKTCRGKSAPTLKDFQKLPNDLPQRPLSWCSRLNDDHDDRYLTLQEEDTKPRRQRQRVSQEQAHNPLIDHISCQQANKRFTPTACIGSGAFSKVFVGKHPAFKGAVAAKVMNKAYVKRYQGPNGYLDEISNLHRARGSFIARLLDSFETNDHVWIITQFYAGGDFLSYIGNYAPFTLLGTQFYTAELACALAHLHGNHIYFGDLKPENIVMDPSGHVRLIDFGLSIHELTSSRCSIDAKTGRSVFHTGSGTLAYAAPELFSRDQVGYEADWWALGAITFEMVTGASPFYDPEDTDPQVLCTRVCTQEVDFEGLNVELGNANCGAESFLKGLLEKRPADRLGRKNSDEVLGHPFLLGLDWSLVAAEFYQPPVVPPITDHSDIGMFCNQVENESLALPSEKGPSCASNEKC